MEAYVAIRAPEIEHITPLFETKTAYIRFNDYLFTVVCTLVLFSDQISWSSSREIDLYINFFFLFRQDVTESTYIIVRAVTEAFETLTVG